MKIDKINNNFPEHNKEHYDEFTELLKKLNDKEKIIIYDELSERLDSDNITSTYPFTDIRNRRIEEMAEDAEWTEDSYDDNMLNLLKQIQYHTLLFS